MVEPNEHWAAPLQAQAKESVRWLLQPAKDWAQPEQCPAKLSFTTPHRRAEQIKHGVDGRHAGKKLEIKMEHKGMEDNVAHTRPKVAPSERI